MRGSQEGQIAPSTRQTTVIFNQFYTLQYEIQRLIKKKY